jgi:hypothetical protein
MSTSLTGGGTSNLDALTVSGAASIGGGLTLGSATQSTPSGTAPLFGARAWCTWNGATTGSYSPTLPSGNISTIARNSAGLYTITFATPMPDNEYVVTWGADGIPTMGIGQSAYPLMGVVTKQSTYVQIQFYSYAGSSNIPTGLDVIRAHIAIFR